MMRNSLVRATTLFVLAASSAAALAVVEEPECADRFTGGGYIFDTPTGARANYGVGGGIQNGELWGHLNWIDHSTTPGMHVKGTSVTSYEVTGETSRRSTGTCTIDGVEGTYVLDITDNGEPGRDDTIRLELSNGYVAGGVVDGGNIQLHKTKCRDHEMEHIDDFVE